MGDARVLDGRYRLGDKLGEGGMGVVYRATDLRLERPVAVKLLHPDAEGSNARLERFLREAKQTARLRHPGIVEVHDFGRTAEGEAYFVMELLEGEPLSARLRREGRLPPAKAVHVARQICDALAVAHAAGIVRRDLKPANVLLVRAPDDDARVKVVDFGVAKNLASGTKLTESGMLVGTIDYMAPEQIRGDTVDGRADIYALGGILTAMLTGELLFEADNVASVVHKHLSVTPRTLRERRPELSSALDAVVRRCLLKDPAARFGTMEALGSALAAALEGKEPAPAPTREPLPALRPASELEVELDEPERPVHLELEEIERPAVSRPPPFAVTDAAVAPTALARPPPPAPLAVSAPAPEWVERLAIFPIAVSKRIVGYSVVALVLLYVFFRPSLVITAAVALTAVAGGVLTWARYRVERVERGPRT